MKNAKYMLTGYFLVVFMSPIARTEAARREPLNFVVIMADDLGAVELGCYGHPKHKTPNLDLLAATGTRFRTCWSTPLCSPTRVEIMTGRYGFRTGWYNFLGRVTTPMDHIDPDEPTFADMLKTKGYATGLAGKWQLGLITKQPSMIFDSGFDEYCTWVWNALPVDAEFSGGPRQRYWHPAVIQNGRHLPCTPEQYGPDVYSDWLIEFMRKSKKERKPFLAYYPMCLTHEPWDPTPVNRSPGPKTEGGLQANVEYMDKIVGRIVDALDEMDLRRNTIVMFTGDNGTARAGKAKLIEAGVRVPMIVNCPNIVKPQVSEALIDLSDVLPTLADFAEAELPEGVTIDGQSFAHIVKGEPGKSREWIFSYLAYGRMLRTHRYMLDGQGRFYDCGYSRDYHEYKDVTDSDDPEVVAARQRFDDILKELPAPQKPEE